MKSRRLDVGLFLFLLILFIRLPFFFRDYIDHDESTFILMGASVADGHLPYAHLWDLKSPFLFYVFGLIETTFPDSFVAVRLFGVLIIFASAFLLVRIADRAGLRNGLLVGVGYAVLSSLFGSLQGVMSEHLAVLFILLALYLFTLTPAKWRILGIAVFTGLALLCKLNYAYACVLFFAFILLDSWKQQGLVAFFVNGILLLTGLLLPFALVSLPFIFQVELKLFIDSTFLAPFAYGHSGGLTFAQKLMKTWWVIVLTGTVCFFSFRISNRAHHKIVIALILLMSGTVISFITSGKVNGHYLIEIYPFLLLLTLGIIFRKNYKPSQFAIGLAVLLLSFESWKEYASVVSNWREKGTPYNGKSYVVLEKLQERNLLTEKIFFADYHITYWHLDEFPLTKSTTHPSNLARPYLFKFFGNERDNSLDELKYILEVVKPTVIVSRKPYISFLPPEGKENLYFTEYANVNFNLIMEDEKQRIYIWQRNTTSLSKISSYRPD